MSQDDNETEKSYEVRRNTSCSLESNATQSAIRLLNGRKARARQNLDDMRGSDDMAKWLELIGYSVY